MNWSLSQPNDLKDIITYLKNNEWLHIQPLSLFTLDGDFVYPKKGSVITLIRKHNNITTGLIVINSKGLIYPMFKNNYSTNINEKKELIKLFSSINLRIHGVLGLKDDVDYLDNILFHRIRGSNNYLILHRDENKLLNIHNQSSIKKATVNDLNRLINLEFEYQKEEVLLNPLDINIRATKENFKNKLKKDDIYFIEDNNIPISKAGTTYKSPNYVLIGGVFTWKSKRNLGYGTELLKYLLNDQLEKGFHGALFVKDNNKPALHLYKKLGFTEQKPYKINYYFN